MPDTDGATWPCGAQEPEGRNLLLAVSFPHALRNWLKKVCRKKKRKLAQLKPQKHLPRLKIELGEKVAIVECGWLQAAQRVCVGGGYTVSFALYFPVVLVIWTDFKTLDWEVTLAVWLWLQEGNVRYDGTSLNNGLVSLPFLVNYILGILIYYFPFPFLCL